MYLAKLARGEFRNSAKGDAFMVLNWTITDGEFEGVDIGDWNRMVDDVGLGFVTRKLRDLGADLPEDVTQIPEALAELVESNPIARIQVKVSGEYRNVYVNRLVSDSGDDFTEAPDTSFDFGANVETDEEAEAETDADDDGIEIVVGLDVEVEGKGEGTVTKLDEDNGLVHVKMGKSKKTIVATPDAVLVL